MDNIKKLIYELKQMGILLWESDGKISYKSPIGVMSEEIKKRIIDNKDNLIEYLKEMERIKRIKIIKSDAVVEINPLENNYSNYNDVKSNVINELSKFETEASDRIYDISLSEWVKKANDVALRDMFKTFYNGNIFHRGKYYNLEDIIRILKIDDDYKKFIEKWLNLLCNENIIKLENKGYKLIDYSFINKINEDYWCEFENLEKQINYGWDFYNYMNMCSKYLLDILQKKIRTVDILFPGGSENNALGLYSDNKGSKLFNMLVAKMIQRYIQLFNGKKTIKILEIGAGIGGTTRFVIDRIQDENFEYYYTDISLYFLNKAREKYGDIKMHYKLFDINESFYKQGFGDEKFDIILCANMLHNSKNGFDSLKTINYLLNSRGMLIIIDEISEPAFLLTSIELNDALTNFYDDRSKNNGIFFTYEQWKNMFKASKVDIWAEFPKKDSDLSYTGQRLFVGNFTKSYYINEEVVKAVAGRDCFKKVVIVDNIDKVSNIKQFSNKKSENIQEKTLIQLVNIWKEILQVDNITVTDNFFDVGGDSLVITQLITKLWNTYPATKELKWKQFTEIIFNNPILKDLANFLDRFSESKEVVKESTSDKLTELIKVTDPKRVYVLFHDGTGELNIYDDFIDTIIDEEKKDISVYGFRIDNIEEFNKETFYKDLAEEYADIIISQFENAHVIFVGHCVGGLLALETASILSNKGIDLIEVIMISSYLNEGNLFKDTNVLKHYLESEFLMSIIFSEVIGSRQDSKMILGELGEEIKNVLEHMIINNLDSFETAIKSTKKNNNNLYTLLKKFEKGEFIPLKYTKKFDLFKKHFLAASEYKPSKFKGIIKFVHGALPTNNFFMEGKGLFNDNEILWEEVLDRDLIYVELQGDHFSIMNRENCSIIIRELLYQ